jgi:hypothetical protein
VAIELPPTISILLHEPPPEGDFAEVKRWFRRLSPELRRQADWSESSFKYAEPTQSPNQFVVAPSGGLDPLRSTTACGNPACRIKAARQFARTVGLYADHILLADEVSSKLVAMRKFSDEQIFRFAIDVTVLQELGPLLSSGLVSFRSLFDRYCDTHLDEFLAATRKVAEEIIAPMNLKLKPLVTDDGLLLDVHQLYGFPMLHEEPLDKQTLKTMCHQKARQHAAQIAALEVGRYLVQDTALALGDAATIGGTVLSGSRMSLLALKKLDSGGKHSESEWEAASTVDLPWVRELSIQQVLALRDAAPDALRRLRISFATSASGVASERLAQLRDESEEIRAELSALQRRRQTTFRNVSGVLGLTIAVYGFATGFVPPAPALASLMTLLGLLHASEHAERADADRLRIKPGCLSQSRRTAQSRSLTRRLTTRCT